MSKVCAKQAPDTPEEIGRRLRRLRRAFGFGHSPSRWAEWLGDVTAGQWAFYEKGERWLSPEVAIRLCDKTGTSMDYLYRGHEGSCQVDTLARINATPPVELLPPARKRMNTNAEEE